MNGFGKLVLVFLMVIVLFLPLVISGPSGRPIMTPNEWMPAMVGDVGWVDADVDSLRETEVAAEPASPGEIFRWQDESGQWRYSNQQRGPIVTPATDQPAELENVIEATVTEGDNSSNIRSSDGLSTDSSLFFNTFSNRNYHET